MLICCLGLTYYFYFELRLFEIFLNKAPRERGHCPVSINIHYYHELLANLAFSRHVMLLMLYCRHVWFMYSETRCLLNSWNCDAQTRLWQILYGVCNLEVSWLITLINESHQWRAPVTAWSLCILFNITEKTHSLEYKSYGARFFDVVGDFLETCPPLF